MSHFDDELLEEFLQKLDSIASNLQSINDSIHTLIQMSKACHCCCNCYRDGQEESCDEA